MFRGFFMLLIEKCPPISKQCDIISRSFSAKISKMSSQGVCPLLASPEKYVPDTLDLLTDKEAREYWLNALELLVEKYTKFALRGRADNNIEERAKRFKKCYMDMLSELRTDPLVHGSLTIRLLLDLSESCLKAQGFHDLWKQQKSIENEAALLALKDRLAEVDKIDDFENKWIELSKGVLAGNMFDWGATAVTQIIEDNANFGLKEALERIQKRPWLFDNLDQFIHNIRDHSYKCVAIFVDNSGVDVILGILPFARQLLLNGSRVIMCANESPALNDVTCTELKEIMDKVCLLCPVISSAVIEGRLCIRSSGQHGPCLDLRTLHEGHTTLQEITHLIPDLLVASGTQSKMWDDFVEIISIPQGLCNELMEKGTDLIVLEGMGRALHTNLYARLSCDSLKMAVVKNSWLAQRLGGPLFSVVFLYEQNSHH